VRGSTLWFWTKSSGGRDCTVESTSVAAIGRGGYSCGECVYHPTSGLRHLLSIVEGLGAEARGMWDRCYSRRFDMGFQGFDERFHSNWQVSGRLMRRLADVEGDLVVTIYRDDEPVETR